MLILLQFVYSVRRSYRYFISIFIYFDLISRKLRFIETSVIIADVLTTSSLNYESSYFKTQRLLVSKSVSCYYGNILIIVILLLELSWQYL